VENNALKISFLQLYFSETRSSDCKRCGQLSDSDGWESTEDEDGWGDAMVLLFIAKERAPQVVAIARNTSGLASALYRQRLAKQTQHKHTRSSGRKACDGFLMWTGIVGNCLPYYLGSFHTNYIYLEF
jgi:hypothetical protein